ncbi:hypothetical protein [Flavobacterium sp. 3HN19-14]|uniref:hypothetical protein n=1 Tax=Flavobacterium sp. 3HN19-14 TaxID=3448133 RepID=UPI003EE3E113
MEIIACGLILYSFRWLTVMLFLEFQKPLMPLTGITSLTLQNQSYLLFEVGIQIILTLYYIMCYDIVSRFIKINSIFLLLLLISPLLFEISNIFRDQSCLDPWLHPQILLWYLALKSLWTIPCIWLLIKWKVNWNGRNDYTVVACGFLIYHILKIGLIWNI